MAAVSNTIGVPLDPPIVNVGYDPEANVGAAGLHQYATQIAIALQPPVIVLPPMVPISNVPIPAFQPPTLPPRTPVTNVPIVPVIPAPPIPVQPLRNIELPIPVYDGSVVTRPINTHPQRYTVNDNDWNISAKSEGMGEGKEIVPITFQKGIRPTLKPVLKANGIVVKAGNDYLVSPETLAVLEESRNPHYDIAENGTVLNAPMGKTIPIIEVNIANLPATGSKRDITNLFAGVASVDYIYETPEKIAGIPYGLVEQINYTLDPNTERPMDTFNVYQLALNADYSVEQLTIETAQLQGQLDRTKLQSFLTGIKSRLDALRRDFNIVKSTFYTGQMSESDVIRPVMITKRATSDDTEEEINKPLTSTYSITTSTLISTLATGSAATPAGNIPSATTATTSTNSTTSTTGTQVGSTTIGTASTQNTAIIAQWQAYGFTSAEKTYIKGLSNASLAAWSPGICTKARIVGQIVLAPANQSAADQQVALLSQYYGTGRSMGEYIELNVERKEALVALGHQIRELEEASGTIY